MSRRRLLLGELETAVLDVLWTHGPCTVAEVVAHLPDERTRHYNTCSTVLTRLTKREIVAREPQPGTRAHRFAARVTREELGRVYLDVVRNDLFGGSFGRVVSSLLEGKTPDPERQAELEALLEDWPADTDGRDDASDDV